MNVATHLIRNKVRSEVRGTPYEDNDPFITHVSDESRHTNKVVDV